MACGETGCAEMFVRPNDIPPILEGDAVIHKEKQVTSGTMPEKGLTAMKTKVSGLWRWTKRVLVGIAGLVLVVLLAGAVFQFVMTRIDAHKYPAPGEMADAGDQPRTSEQIVKELHTLLGNAGVKGPYVLVGHSFCGTNMQVYGSQYPDEVAGMVLVDSALEDDKAVALTQSLQPSPLLLKIYATIGLTRLPYTLGGETSGLTSPELEDEQAAISSHRKHIFAVADETSSLEESFDENRTDPMSLGDKPLMVLTAGSVQLAGTGLSQAQVNLIDKLHSESQAALTQRSENAKQIIVEDSGHYIHVEQPGLVTDAIHQVVEAARDGSRLSGNET